MLAVIARRLISLPLVVVSVTFLVFVVGYLAPGDPILTMMGNQRDPVVYENLRHLYGLDLPWSEQYWRYLVEVWGDPSAPHDPLAMGVGECLQIIVDATGEACGYAMVAAKLWGSDLQIMSVELAPQISLVSAAPPLLRALHAYGDRLPGLGVEKSRRREVEQ